MKQAKKQSKAEQRVTLARDVIRQIQGWLEVEAGAYITGDLFYTITDQVELENGGKQDARKVLKKLRREGEPCTVCAKGALLIAHVLRNDKMKLERFQKLADGLLACSSPGSGTYPRGIAFTAKQLDEIEGLFEGGIVGEETKRFFTSEEEQAVKDWYGYQDPCTPWSGFLIPRIESDHERLIAIMRLVIKNKGKKILL